MGTPLTALMLERCAQTIEQVIIPNVTGAFAAEQAMYIAALLHILAPALEEKCQPLREENERMREVLGRVLAALRAQKALVRNPVRNEVMRKLDDELKKATAGIRDAGEENDALKEALVAAINGLDALTEHLPVETLSSLRQQIRSVLRQQLDHGVAGIFDALAARGAER